MIRVILAVFALTITSFAQHQHGEAPKPQPASTQPQHQHGEMKPEAAPQQQHEAEPMGEHRHSATNTLIDNILHHTSDGTSVEPNSVRTPMWMTQKGGWELMLHGTAFLNVQQQTGPRGRDKFFSTNWVMPMAQRRLGTGTLTFRGMFSLEPATVTGRYYPLMFQTGETANGRPIVDGQHPHDFFMEIAALYDQRIGEKSLLSFYAAPIGSPAIGPTAYPHRTSTLENPLAALGHHQQDSTHIAADVFTVGLTHRAVRIEASGFHGREPDEERWNIDQGAVDSWSARLTVNPHPNWSGQVSLAHIRSPESLHPDDDARRQTASVMYHRPLARGFWSSTLLWGRNKTGHHGNVFNAYLLESTMKFAEKNHVWTRIENVDRSNELLYPKGTTPPPGFEEAPYARVQAYSFGYSRSLPSPAALDTALGTQVTLYGTPERLRTQYGSSPAGILVFLRFRPR